MVQRLFLYAWEVTGGNQLFGRGPGLQLLVIFQLETAAVEFVKLQSMVRGWPLVLVLVVLYQRDNRESSAGSELQSV